MPKKARFDTFMDGPHVKVYERLPTSARQYVCHISSERNSAQKMFF